MEWLSQGTQFARLPFSPLSNAFRTNIWVYLSHRTEAKPQSGSYGQEQFPGEKQVYLED